MSEIVLGATYKDAVSGFEGVATSTTLFLFACERVYLSQGHSKEDGKEISAIFDAAQLDLVKQPGRDIQKAIERMNEKTAPKVEPAPRHFTAPRTGGDRPTPSAVR